MEMYHGGISVPLDYREAIRWSERIAAHCEREYGAEHPVTLTALHDLTVMHLEQGDYRRAAGLRARLPR